MIERVEAAALGLRPRAAWRVPWTLLIFLATLTLPWVGSRYDTFIGTQIAIYSLFAMSLNLLLGTTGLVSFGHAAYFGIGSYGCGILMKMLGVPFWLSFPAAGLIAAAFAVVFGFFCVRLTKIYFAMLTLAFAQIVWAICFKWNDLTGGDQGLPDVPFPDLAWLGSLPGFQRFRIGELFYVLTLVLVALCIAALRRLTDSPFGRVLTAIRENPERAASIGVNVRAYELAAFAIAGGFAGLSGALFGIFNRGVFADFVFWSKSADVMIMTILGGMQHFWGPAVGALVLTLLNQQITAFTEYWPFVLGTILVVLLFAFPGGILGALEAALSRVVKRRDA
ncbi:MAG TPA: branched-chain amino acid ABC transporter permease [Stellaceae bacterium]|jgi:branched-chain amino acid transport system permease protein|nr:branched-chain amino acid ABC transporter permease [Stellaceae bacterium]